MLFVSIATIIQKLLQNINLCNYLPTVTSVLYPCYTYVFAHGFCPVCCVALPPPAVHSPETFSRKKSYHFLRFHFMGLSKQSSFILLPFIDHFRKPPLLLFQFELIFPEYRSLGWYWRRSPFLAELYE